MSSFTPPTTERPDPFRGRDVLVVGPNTSGSEIAYELVSHGAARVRVSMRTPPYISRREWPRGVPVNPISLLRSLEFRPTTDIRYGACIG